MNGFNSLAPFFGWRKAGVRRWPLAQSPIQTELGPATRACPEGNATPSSASRARGQQAMPSSRVVLRPHRRPMSNRKCGRIKNQVMIDKYPPICDPENALATQLLILPPLTHPKILRQDLGSALSIQTDRAHSAASTFAAEFQSSVAGLEWNRSPRMEIPMESGSRPDRSTSSPWPQERELGEVGH